MGNNLVVTVTLDNDRHVCNPMDMVVLPGDTVIWRWTGAGKLEVSFPADNPFDQPGPLAQDVPATVKKDAKPGKHKTETKIGGVPRPTIGDIIVAQKKVTPGP